MSSFEGDDLRAVLGRLAERVESDLRRWLIEPGTPQKLAEAMNYCVLGGGKRLRPAMVHLCALACGGWGDELTARAAVAVECVHTYSLVHDDLPAMDDDTLRRGRPTAHVQFGEAMAILVGDALLTRAFGVLGESGQVKAVELVRELAAGAGSAGMIAGQAADMDLTELPEGLEGTDYIHSRKTAALIVAAARMGAICAGAASEALAAVTQYAHATGMAFQLTDDMLDVTATSEQLGKTAGKDVAAGKRTHVAALGLERTRQIRDELTCRAVATLAPLGTGGDNLRGLAEFLAGRSR